MQRVRYGYREKLPKWFRGILKRHLWQVRHFSYPHRLTGVGYWGVASAQKHLWITTSTCDCTFFLFFFSPFTRIHQLQNTLFKKKMSLLLPIDWLMLLPSCFYHRLPIFHRSLNARFCSQSVLLFWPEPTASGLSHSCTADLYFLSVLPAFCTRFSPSHWSESLSQVLFQFHLPY